MHVLVSGASGLIGTELVRTLRRKGTSVSTLVRRNPRDTSEICWQDQLDLPPALNADAVVHLAGEPIMGIWTPAKQRRIHDSRVLRTRELVDALIRQATKPRVLVSASAIGFYGSQGDEILTEASWPGEGFLAETSVKWERATAPASAAGIRVVNLRTSVVLSQQGGALKAMLPPFRLGLGSQMGDGKHWMSWIALDDMVRIIELVIEADSFTGPVNCASPNPVTNAEFSNTLASVLHRPTFLPIPRLLLKLLPGNIADEALLASERVVPEKLINAGFEFRQPKLRDALESALI
jgi:uncharacterized protein (TIGR01777 family)